MQWWRYITTAMLAVIAGGAMQAQTGMDTLQAAIMVVGRSYPDSVVLRWAPTTPGAWRMASEYGYRIYRRAVTNDGLEEATLLTPQPIKPWPLDVWQQRIDTADRFMLVAAQVLSSAPGSPSGGIGGLLTAADMLRNRFAFALFSADMSRRAAEGLGLRFVDTTAVPERVYLYTVVANVPDSVYPIEPGDVSVTAGLKEEIPRPIGFQTLPGDRRITLQWINHPGITAYWIERSDDRGKTYRRLNHMPYTRIRHRGDNSLEMTFVDATVKNYVRYYYRIIGITPFGELSDPVEASGMARDMTPPAPPSLLDPIVMRPTRVRLRWEYPDTARDVAGFLVMRGSDPQKGYAPLHFPPLSPQARRFVDSHATAAEPYYVVTAIDTGGNASRSMPVKAYFVDTFPPAIPRGLQGTIDTEGVVHLWWHPNTEADLLGYRVLWANSPRHEFSQRTNRPISDTFFTDTINIRTLTRYVYYRVSAVDLHYNHSPMSAVLRLRRPDLTPPVPAVFRRITPSDTGIHLQWSASTSDDAAFQRIQRKVVDSTRWENLATLPPGHASFDDYATASGVRYAYRIVTFDSSGHYSISDEVTARTYPRPLAPPAFVRGQYDSTDLAIVLQWEYPYPLPSEGYFIIYRGIKDAPMRPYRHVPLSDRTFKDRFLPAAGLYRYAVKIARGTFNTSPLSRAVWVRLQ